jgi:hypothetical protein
MKLKEKLKHFFWLFQLCPRCGLERMSDECPFCRYNFKKTGKNEV